MRITRRELESDDIEVSRIQPKQGMIGIAGMVLSLSPVIGASAVGVVADTIGASSDVLAADRMAKWIEQAFDVSLDLDLDTTKETAAKLLEEIGVEGAIEEYLGMKKKRLAPISTSNRRLGHCGPFLAILFRFPQRHWKLM